LSHRAGFFIGSNVLRDMGSAYVGRSRLDGCVVLVVEDEPLVSLDVVEMLTTEGAQVVCANTARQAIQSIERFKIKAAVLDINLGSHDCTAICQYLWDRKIPFLFHTGYSAPLDGWASVPVVHKPAARDKLTEAVERLCGTQQQAA
jgi:CheY-like chemotaxis protein